MKVIGFVTTLAATRAILDDDRPLLDDADDVPELEGSPGDTSTRWTWNGETFAASYGDGEQLYDGNGQPAGFARRCADILPPQGDGAVPFVVVVGDGVGVEDKDRAWTLVAAMEMADDMARDLGWEVGHEQPATPAA